MRVSLVAKDDFVRKFKVTIHGITTIPISIDADTRAIQIALNNASRLKRVRKVNQGRREKER